MPGRKYTRDDLIYFAGIIDGEGCVEARLQGRSSGVGTSAGNMSIQLVIGNTDPRLIAWLVSKFGGRVSEYDRGSVNPNARTLYSWRIPVRRERALMEEVFPFLKLKGDQLALAFKLADTAIKRGRGRCVNDKTLARRQVLVKQISDLKRG